MRIITRLFALMLALLPTLLYAQEDMFTRASLKEVQEKARREKKLLFIDLMFEGCMPCKQMEKQVFPDSAVLPYLEKHFVSFQGDIFKELDAKLLARKFGVTGAPHYLIFNGEGQLVEAGSGFMGKKYFLPFLEKAVTDAKAGVVKKYRPGTDGAYPEFYSNFFLVKFRSVAIDTVVDYLETQKDLNTEENYAVLNLNLNRLPQQYKDYYYSHMQQFAKDFGQKSTGMAAYKMLEGRAAELGKAKDFTGFKALMENANSLYSPKDWKTFGKIIGTGFFKTLDDPKAYISFADGFNYTLAARATLAAELAPAIKDPELLSTMHSWLNDDAIGKAEKFQADGLWYVKGLLEYYLGEKDAASNSIARINAKSYYGKFADALHKAIAGDASFTPGKITIPEPLLAD